MMTTDEKDKIKEIKMITFEELDNSIHKILMDIRDRVHGSSASYLDPAFAIVEKHSVHAPSSKDINFTFCNDPYNENETPSTFTVRFSYGDG